MTQENASEPQADRRIARGHRAPMGFVAIWLALVALIIVSAIFVSRSLLPTSILAIIPFAAFLAITAMGESLVLMTRGFDPPFPPSSPGRARLFLAAQTLDNRRRSNTLCQQQRA